MNTSDFESIKELARQGDTNAQFKLGLLYEHGNSVTKNKKEALKWFSLSADQGYAFAQCSLGFMYYYGAVGVLKNNVNAIKWLKRAAAQDYYSAKNRLQEIENETNQI